MVSRAPDLALEHQINTFFYAFLPQIGNFIFSPTTLDVDAIIGNHL